MLEEITGVDKLADTVKIKTGTKGQKCAVGKKIRCTVNNQRRSDNSGGKLELEDAVEKHGQHWLEKLLQRPTTSQVTERQRYTSSQIIIREGFKMLNLVPMILKKGIQGAVDIANWEIKKNSKEVETKEVLG